MSTNIKRSLIVLFIGILCPGVMVSQIRIVTSTTDLAEFVSAVGGNKVEVDFIVRGNQNPHYIEIKPSYMLKLRSADLFFIVGMGFEIWYKQVIDGSRNSDLRVIDCSEGITKLEVPATRIDPRMGDVHPYGNPHYWLDPLNIKVILGTIVGALSSIAPADSAFFRQNADQYIAAVESQLSGWQDRMQPFAGREIVTYHTTFTYFVQRYGLNVAGYVEPKPGIPPTPLHITRLITAMRDRNIRTIGVEQYYELNVPRTVATAVDGTVIRLISSIGGSDDAHSYIALIEHNISELERTFR